MARRRKIFFVIFSFAANFCFVLGDYNEQCPVPDLAELCESDCNDAMFNCIIDCAGDQGANLIIIIIKNKSKKIIDIIFNLT